MFQSTDGTTYKSRIKVLADFFKRSRDKWKRKCIESKAKLKKANNRGRWLQSSRDHWKARAAELQTQLDAADQQQKTSAPKASPPARGPSKNASVRPGTPIRSG